MRCILYDPIGPLAVRKGVNFMIHKISVVSFCRNKLVQYHMLRPVWDRYHLTRRNGNRHGSYGRQLIICILGAKIKLLLHGATPKMG
jgi:hypothetical protein